MRKNFLTALFICGTMATNGQTKQTGNVVEYFGKEKIETTDEGRVVHHFRQGLILPGATAGGTLFNGQDIVAWMYASGNFKTPQAADTLAFRYGNVKTDRPLVWEALDADTAGNFANRAMRGAYLYTRYDSPREQVLLLETTGGTRTFINGMPHEGDHYDFGYSLVPFKLKKGLNEIVYTPGRFGRVSTKLVQPEKPVMFTKRDMTLPDIIIGEQDSKWAAVRLINATERDLRGMKITATLPDGTTQTVATDDVMPMSVRKVKFQVPALATQTPGEVQVQLTLTDARGKVIDRTEISVQVRTADMHHERTFISRIDHSVQYYSIAPAVGGTEGKALVLSVHGASVEARNQARAYRPKDWVTIVAATNRRPFGFNWEEWGRIDALEVLEEAKRVFKTNPRQTYLTGHSMGGHGTWFLGTTYPDKFAAIAPCASYPDIIGYGSGRGDNQHKSKPAFETIERSANAGRVIALAHNLVQSGVYILHGDADSTVPIEQVRQMRSLLGGFHPNFCYYEYPGGSHWYGDHSVDWFPIFEFFKRQTIPANKDVKELVFHTASPVVSSQDYWLKVEQQESPYHFTRVKATQDGSTITLDPENAVLLTLDIPSLEMKADPTVTVGDFSTVVPRSTVAHLAFVDGKWGRVAAIDSTQKYAERQGGFKQAFDNNVVLVYATGGNRAENEWWQNKARFDAETFYYRGNGSMDVVADRDFSLAKYRDCNVVIYGNADNNSAWKLLLEESPIQVRNGQVSRGDAEYQGADLATYFVTRRADSNCAMVGVVAASGTQGMWATSPNNYISGITGFPEFMIFRSDLLRDGLEEMVEVGFFDNNWK